ncbi:cellulose synthase-like protein G3 [Impatiens glandulifera]|uniref:cellulose synthase-like protein G3 n=1 Tax=Impatiens glandulifera TaxID=253017 RepID=UPI001FB0A318|nr:cellulose synthase-like protein G3 [Impatiens glandulifera]
MAPTDPKSLHTCTVEKTRAAINRLHILIHTSAILALIYYRLSHLLYHKDYIAPLPWALMTTAELIFTLIWIFTQSFRWRPIVRTVSPQNLPADVTCLPSVDVFICTADPTKEPVVEVMNTVISAMALDYPPEKLGVYLSDDGGSPLTAGAIKEAFGFAKIWVPFCRKYMIKTRCPEAFFSPLEDDERLVRNWNEEFKADELRIKYAYEVFKQNVEKMANQLEQLVFHDRPAHIEIIHENKVEDEENNNNGQAKLPLLVYLSREKRPSHPHRFKAGALNALLRVSGIMSNGPYVLVLDCDMYCNDATSVKQAMCFHLDEKMSSSLAFVQYPQIFHNVGKNDIYDGQARSAYKTKWQGMDGLRGPLFTGTGYYVKRKSLYGYPNREDVFLLEAERNFGWSSKLIDSLKCGNLKKPIMEGISYETLQEAKKMASCTFEEGTQWGNEVGYSYYCLLESTFTGYLLHCRGWRSVYLYPERPCFLGCTPIDMKDALVQQMKWSSGLLQVGLSKFSPLTYGLSRMCVFQSTCYAYFTFISTGSIAFLIYGTVPQLCFLSGIPVYPKVSSPWFAVFVFIYASALLQHMYEVMSSGGSIKSWWNEQRMWLMRLATGCLFGMIDFLMKWLGLAKTKFLLTNKAVDKEKLEKYEMGKYNFEGAEVFMVPLTVVVVVNMVGFIGGMRRLVFWDDDDYGGLDQMFGQLLLSSIGLVMGYPILEGILISNNRKKKM